MQPRLPNIRLFSSQARIFGDEKLAKSTDLSSFSFKFKAHGKRLVFRRTETWFCSWMDDLAGADRFIPLKLVRDNSLIRDPDTGIDAFSRQPRQV